MSIQLTYIVFGSAPLDNNSSTTLICPSLAAPISGVKDY